jgi:CheY-like chemotaxis protein
MSSEKPSRPAAGLRVLVVEDEIVVALLLEEMLAELGHKVIGPVSRIDIAVEMAQGEAFDVAILDVNLEGKEAYPVADAIGARGIPYVFATGYGNHGLRAPYRNRPTLSKPFLQRDLLQALAVACPAKLD